MKPAPFEYEAPGTTEEACALLAAAGGGATILAGGQTLMPLLALRLSQPFLLVDINRIAALRGVSRSGGGVRIGPATRQNAVIADPILADLLPVLVRATRHVGHHQTRTRGTFGGSICFGEPAAELPATAVALGAVIEARSVRGTRRIAAAELYLGPYATALAADEVVTGIEFPDWSVGVPIFREVAMRPGDFALVGLVGMLAVANLTVVRAGLAWFGMGPTPVKAVRTEAALVGQAVAGLDIAGLAELAVSETDPFTDSHVSAEYRRRVGRRVFVHALREALAVGEAA